LHLRNLQLMRWKGEQRQQVYEHVIAIQVGFEQAVQGLGELRKCDAFEMSEIKRLRDLAAEARAATLSYLINIVEALETDEAAQLQGHRLKRESRADMTNSHGDGLIRGAGRVHRL
jgi:hypothetical protein